ncbi:MAG TPA: alpha/beta hydrolase [Gaiellaceae bacterium]|jgi:pimeloyl-ACP methyl ester carboxylesterase|nr:alpha/beta hydrolase [Gaiellaceae bacterium]HWJ43788.1 alpha/beta hydrolase [Gaiellaceae bacterium]
MGADGQTVVLIHGMWMTPRSWDNWVDHYRDRGYKAIAPGWPGVKDPDETRADPSALKGLGVARMVDHYDSIIRELDRPPIIMGHSFGGLITQLLLNRGLGAAGVTIGTAPPNGVVILPVSTLRSSLPALKNPLNRNGLAGLSPKQFRYRFTNTLGAQESDAIYREHYIPGTNRAFFDVLFSKSAAGVDWANARRAPLLLIAASLDHISPIPLNRTLLERHGRAASATELKEYAGKTHYMAGMDGWEEIADYALNWALEHQQAPAASEPLSSSAPSQ